MKRATTALMLAAPTAAVAWLALTASGRLAYSAIFYFMEFYAGVFTLLLLTATVIGGLLSTDRLVLTIRQRVLLQTAHRTSGVAAVAVLVPHIMTKVAMGKVSPTAAVLPFAGTVYVALGTIAAYLMVTVMVTGVLRARFAGNARPWLWRALHSTTYLSWPVAIMHGLTAGRTAATWVTASYLICLVLVTGVLFLRLAMGGTRGATGTMTGTGTGTINMKPVGRPVERPVAAPVKAPRVKAPPIEPFRQGIAGDVAVGASVEEEWTERGSRRDRGRGETERVDVLESGGRPRRPRGPRGPGGSRFSDDDQLTGRGTERTERSGRAEWGGRAERDDAGSQWGADYVEPRPARYEAEPVIEEEPEPRYPTERIPLVAERRRRSTEPPTIEEYGWEVEERSVSGPPRHRVSDDVDPYEEPETRTRMSRHETRRDSADPYQPFANLPPDDTPTLVDLATRRAMRVPRDAGAASARPGRRRRAADDMLDDQHWAG